MMPHGSLEVTVLVALGAPVILLLVLGSTSLLRRPLHERWTRRLVMGSMTCSAVATTTALAGWFAAGAHSVVLSPADWSTASGNGIRLEFLLDGMSLGFATLSAVIVGVVAAFSNRYLHREPGYNRYFVLLALFVVGLFFVALAGNVEVLFAGWEFVGLSSTLLVAFFHDRPGPVSNALRVQAVYRISDAAMLSAAVLLHHAAGSGSLVLLVGGAQAGTEAVLSSTTATTIALLLVVAVAAKSALLPFSGWLPRAMEGPTPSSAVYYGALSVHAGCFVLLRAAPLLEQAPLARALCGALGLLTAIFATLTARVQTDIKSSLSYAALTQVGIIVLEIALGLYVIAFVHLVGHASFRLLQFLSAPNILHDLHSLESLSGTRPDGSETRLEHWMPAGVRQRLYLVALERGFLDASLDRFVVTPFERIAYGLSRVDRFLCDVAIGDVRGSKPADCEGSDE